MRRCPDFDNNGLQYLKYRKIGYSYRDDSVAFSRRGGHATLVRERSVFYEARLPRTTAHVEEKQ